LKQTMDGQKESGEVDSVKMNLLVPSATNIGRLVVREKLVNSFCKRKIPIHTITQHAVLTGNNCLSQLKILVVDDHEFIRLLVATMLENGGASVDVSHSFDDAYRRLLNGSYDMIICDIVIDQNGRNGMEFIRTIRMGLTAAKEDVRVIVLTSYSSSFLQLIATALDVSCIIVKPAAARLLVDKIQSALNSVFRLRPRIAYKVVPTETKSIVAAATLDHHLGLLF